jgi:hypothetical protein
MSTTPEQLQETLTSQPKQGMMERSVVIRVTLNKPGRVKKVKVQQLVDVVKDGGTVQQTFEGLDVPEIPETEAVSLINTKIDTDPGMLRISKYILDSEEMTAIRQYDGRIRRYMLTQALPSIFQNGAYLVALDSVGEIDITLGNFQEGREPLVEAACAVYEKMKEEAKEKLGPLYEESDYLPVEQFRAKFGMTFEYISYGVSEKLRQISSALVQREQQKTQARWAKAEEAATALLTEQMKKVVSGLAEKLNGSTEDGKKKQLKKPALDPIKEFLDTFKNRNAVLCNAELEALAHRAGQLIENVDTDQLKKEDALRESLGRGFADIEKSLDSMIETMPARTMRLDFDIEEDEE